MNHTIDYPECFNSNDYFEEKPNLLFKSNLSQQNQYFLNGIIIHYGSADSGHKTAFCKNFFDDNWYYFNDTSKYSMKFITKDILNRKDAFILIYQNSSIEINSKEKKLIKEICDKNIKSRFNKINLSKNCIFNSANFSISNTKYNANETNNNLNNSDDSLLQTNNEPITDNKLHDNITQENSNRKFFFFLFLIILALVFVIVMKLCNIY